MLTHFVLTPGKAVFTAYLSNKCESFGFPKVGILILKLFTTFLIVMRTVRPAGWDGQKQRQNMSKTWNLQSFIFIGCDMIKFLS